MAPQGFSGTREHSHLLLVNKGYFDVVTKTWNHPKPAKPAKTTQNHQQNRPKRPKTSHKIPIRFNATWKTFWLRCCVMLWRCSAWYCMTDIIWQCWPRAYWGLLWFWLVLCEFGWFWVVPCFSNYGYFEITFREQRNCWGIFGNKGTLTLTIF